MKYLNATMVLPDSLVEELQEYIQGAYLYIPSKKDQHKKWGELSGLRIELDERNERIRRDFSKGLSIEDLAEIYSLSVHTIRKIIYSK
ncbi:CD3324 family protein [Halocella sp. SP3-1]|uniref:CD3324 family protein n=1 Tax=Halocella sp. SP3-1 TaxID=2382161 RepID=UPI000F75857D|nr:CD3324 family protein [Halocella sp. SP3-1]AZO94967.1 hypothetical protein D7D81_10405 [Halocella sp. SP3-1]